VSRQRVQNAAYILTLISVPCQNGTLHKVFEYIIVTANQHSPQCLSFGHQLIV